LHQVGDLFELNVKLWCQNVKYLKRFVFRVSNFLYLWRCSESLSYLFKKNNVSFSSSIVTGPVTTSTYCNRKLFIRCCTYSCEEQTVMRGVTKEMQYSAYNWSKYWTTYTLL